MGAMCRYTASRIAEVAQLVEHRSEKPGVDSSILSLGTTILKRPPEMGQAPWFYATDKGKRITEARQ
jgi:hypothetical protein